MHISVIGGFVRQFRVTVLCAVSLISSVLLMPERLDAGNGDIIRLGGLDDLGDAHAVDINDSGKIVGWGTAAGQQHAVVFNGTAPAQDLGTLGGLSSQATGVNNSGLVVGSARTTTTLHAFLYSGVGSLQDLTPTAITPNRATRISNLGVIVGAADDNGFEHAAIFAAGTYSYLSAFPNGKESVAAAVNDTGTIVGWSSTTAVGDIRAFRYAGSGPMVDLGTLGGASIDYSRASAINDSGQIVGDAHTTGDGRHAFRFAGSGPLQDLGSLGGEVSTALDINNSGIVVGWSSVIGFGPSHATLWRGDNSIVDLDAWLDSVNPSEGSKWTLSAATAINNSGLVVGYGFYNGGAFPNGFEVPFLLDVGALLPEPSLLLPLCGLGALVRRRHHRHHATDSGI